MDKSKIVLYILLIYVNLSDNQIKCQSKKADYFSVRTGTVFLFYTSYSGQD